MLRFYRGTKFTSKLFFNPLPPLFIKKFCLSQRLWPITKVIEAIFSFVYIFV